MRAGSTIATAVALASSLAGCACEAPTEPDGGPSAHDAASADASQPGPEAPVDGAASDAPVEPDASVAPDAPLAPLDAPVDTDAGCADCRGLYPVGEALRVCEGLSTDPSVTPAAPEIVAGAGTFAITCVPSTTASAADDTGWRVDLVDAVTLTRRSVALGVIVIAPPFVQDARVLFHDGRFVTAAEHDCEPSAHLYRGCTGVHSFLPDGSDLRAWPRLTESAGGSFAHGLAPLGAGLLVVRRNGSASDRAWSLAGDLTVTEIARPSGDAGRRVPVSLDIFETTDGFARFAGSDAGLSFTRFAADATALAPPVVVAPSIPFLRPRVSLEILRDGDTYLVAYSDGGEGQIVRLDDRGAELARGRFSLPVGWPHDASLHLAGGLVHVVHPGATPALEVSVFDADLAPLPERSAPFFASGALLYPDVAYDEVTDTFAIVYRAPTGELALQRFTHRP